MRMREKDEIKQWEGHEQTKVLSNEKTIKTWLDYLSFLSLFFFCLIYETNKNLSFKKASISVWIIIPV